MKFRTSGLVIVFSLTILTVTAAMAHHSFDAEYDSKKPITVTGTVTKVDWVNPHAYVSIDSKDESGTVKNYKIEMGPPYALARGGWKRDTLNIGDRVTVVGAALAKDGSNAAGSMQTTHMLLANGQKMVMR
jgi:DNA/RNA endonuclease YhcR with UshA esterase domain